MNSTPAIAFSAYSVTGKTTLIERLIVRLKTMGLRVAVIEQRERTLWQNLQMVHDVDLILVEGYTHEALPRIGISRAAAGTGFLHDVRCYIAVVTDKALPGCPVPKFNLDDSQGLAEFLLAFSKRSTDRSCQHT